MASRRGRTCDEMLIDGLQHSLVEDSSGASSKALQGRATADKQAKTGGVVSVSEEALFDGNLVKLFEEEGTGRDVAFEHLIMVA